MLELNLENKIIKSKLLFVYVTDFEDESSFPVGSESELEKQRKPSIEKVAVTKSTHILTGESSSSTVENVEFNPNSTIRPHSEVPAIGMEITVSENPPPTFIDHTDFGK